MDSPGLTWRRGGAFAFLIGTMCMTSAPLRGQADPDSVKLRNDCRFAEQILLTGQPAPHRSDALATIARCGEEGVPALVATWQGMTADRTEVGALVLASRTLVDPRLTDALESVLGDATKPDLVRVSALAVLVTYGDPSVVPGIDGYLSSASDAPAIRYGHVDHAYPVLGRDRLSPGFVDRLRSLLMGIRTSDPSSQLRLSAMIALNNPPLAN